MFFHIPNTISVTAELSEKASDFSGLKELIDKKNEIENELAKRLEEKIIEQANSKLHSTKEDYLNSLSVEGSEVKLDTSSFVVNMVENGIGSYDLKPGIINGPKAKVNKQGKKYAIVPLSKYKSGRYNWRDRQTGRFDKGSNPGGDVEFRAVSENSDPNSWIHPGHIGFHIFEEIVNSSDILVEDILDAKIDLILNKL